MLTCPESFDAHQAKAFALGINQALVLLQGSRADLQTNRDAEALLQSAFTQYNTDANRRGLAPAIR